MVSEETIRLLNCLLQDIPANPITYELDQEFRICDLTEHKKSNRSLDNEVANFMIKREFATLIHFANPLMDNKESRMLLLTETGKKLHKVGSYEDFIGLPLLIILKVFKVDLYYKWVSLSKSTKDIIKVGGWAIIAAILIEIVRAMFVNKH